MFFCTDNMADFHQMVIHNNRKVVGWNSIGFHDNEVTHTVGFKCYNTAYSVIYHQFVTVRYMQTDNRFAAFCNICCFLFFG